MLIVAVLVMASACTTDDTSDDTTTTTSTASATTQAAVAGDEGAAPASSDDDVPALVASPVVDTGQTSCYDAVGSAIECPAEGEELFGQDASYASIPSAYRDNGDGTVTDLVTGLTWQQDPGDKMTYSDAVVWADAAETAGYDDWRLPSITELYSLVDFGGTDPSGCDDDCGATPFIDDDVFAFSYGDTSIGDRIIDSQWATSTVYVGTVFGGVQAMFGVNFADGRIKGYPIEGDKGYFVLLVRGDEYGVSDFFDEGDGTVADLSTGLVWQQGDSESGMDWTEALDYCETLDLAGFSDWRLPDAKELQSIVDYSRSPSTTGSAAIDPVFAATAIVDEGGASNYGFYWSSTTHPSATNRATSVYVAFGEALGWMQDSSSTTPPTQSLRTMTL